MSNFIEETLTNWGLSQYIEKFKDEQIDEQAFLYMPDSMVKELIPSVGQRFTFLTNRTTLLQNQTSVSNDSPLDITNKNESKANCSLALPLKSESEDNIRMLSSTSEFDNTSIASSSSTDTTCLSREKNIRQLLAESGTGKKLLTQIRLSPSDRNKLCQIIIEKLLSKSMKIKSEEFQEWAAEIVSLFKYEKTSTYYVPSNAKFKRFTNGKLWDKYNNLKKLIRTHKEVCEKENIETIPVCQEALITLRAIQPEDKNLENLWKETFTGRNRGTIITDYYDEYPILKTAIGAKLLQIDFQMKTGIDTLIFHKNWPEIAPYILLLAEKTEVCPSLCELANDISIETLSLFILPYLFKSSNVKTGNKKRWKPSKAEVAESFIFRIPNIADLEPKLHKRKEKLEDYGLTFQPMVIAVGSVLNLTSFYVIVNDVKYTSTSLMNAVNLCFQIFFALDAIYPVDSEMVWYFLQRYVYDITNKKDSRNFISVDTTWHDVQQLMLTRK